MSRTALFGRFGGACRRAAGFGCGSLGCQDDDSVGIKTAASEPASVPKLLFSPPSSR
jgi:hypothetical protein